MESMYRSFGRAILKSVYILEICQIARLDRDLVKVHFNEFGLTGWAGSFSVKRFSRGTKLSRLPSHLILLHGMFG